MNEKDRYFVTIDTGVAPEKTGLSVVKQRLLDRPTLLKMVDEIANATTFDLYDHQIEDIVDAVVKYALEGVE